VGGGTSNYSSFFLLMADRIVRSGQRLYCEKGGEGKKKKKTWSSKSPVFYGSWREGGGGSRFATRALQVDARVQTNKGERKAEKKKKEKQHLLLHSPLALPLLFPSF